MIIRRSVCSLRLGGPGGCPATSREGGGAWSRGPDRHSFRLTPASRCTRNRTAPPTIELLVRSPPSRLPPVLTASSPTATSAVPASRARRVRRTATPGARIGAESITTRLKAPLRSRTSAHQPARAGSFGRIIHNPSSAPRCAQSRGASVRAASMYATHPARASVSSTIRRSSVAVPLPCAPTISVNRPRGTPPPGNASSSASTPVGRVRVSEPATEQGEEERGRRSRRDCGSIWVANRSCFLPTAETAFVRSGELTYPE